MLHCFQEDKSNLAVAQVVAHEMFDQEYFDMVLAGRTVGSRKIVWN